MVLESVGTVEILFVAFVAVPFFAVGVGAVYVIARSTRSKSFSKVCPFCAEVIKREAVVCRYCGRDLPGAVSGK